LEIAFKPAQVQSLDAHDLGRRVLVAHDPGRSALTAEVLTTVAFKTLTADAFRTLIVHAFRTLTAVEAHAFKVRHVRHVMFTSSPRYTQIKSKPARTKARRWMNRAILKPSRSEPLDRWINRGILRSRYPTRGREAIEHRRTKKKIFPL
jgi:hypothetical protein